MPEPIILVDIMSLVWRTHWAFRNLSADGKPTGVLYGTLKTIRNLQDKVSRRLLFAWDHGVPVPGAPRPRNWRDSILSTYKATRKRDNSEWSLVVQQLPILYQLLQWLGYTSVAVDGLEADDVISLLAANTSEDYLIFSTDRDFYQCLTNERVRILVPKRDKKEFKIITAADVYKEYDIEVERWAEYLALGGDSSDNIKPLRGMGPKTAIKLIQAGLDIRKDLWPPVVSMKYVDAIPEIRKSYEVARLPVRWDDPRIKACVAAPFAAAALLQSPIINPDQTWLSPAYKQECLVQFTSWLADHEMNTLLAVRRQFFNQGEQTCKQTTNPQPKPRPAKALRHKLI